MQLTPSARLPSSRKHGGAEARIGDTHGFIGGVRIMSSSECSSGAVSSAQFAPDSFCASSNGQVAGWEEMSTTLEPASNRLLAERSVDGPVTDGKSKDLPSRPGERSWLAVNGDDPPRQTCIDACGASVQCEDSFLSSLPPSMWHAPLRHSYDVRQLKHAMIGRLCRFPSHWVPDDSASEHMGTSFP